MESVCVLEVKPVELLHRLEFGYEHWGRPHLQKQLDKVAAKICHAVVFVKSPAAPIGIRKLKVVVVVVRSGVVIVVRS